MPHYLFVFLGGGLGSICRLGMGHLLAPLRLQYPWATFLSNVVSCFVLGVLVVLATKEKLGSQMAVFLMAGFCGGFSTFSTFTNETFQMLLQGQYAKAAGYMLLSASVCLLSLFVGMKTASQF